MSEAFEIVGNHLGYNVPQIRKLMGELFANGYSNKMPLANICQRAVLHLPELKMSNAAMKLNETSSDAYEKLEASSLPDVIKLKHYVDKGEYLLVLAKDLFRIAKWIQRWLCLFSKLKPRIELR